MPNRSSGCVHDHDQQFAEQVEQEGIGPMKIIQRQDQRPTPANALTRSRSRRKLRTWSCGGSAAARACSHCVAVVRGQQPCQQWSHFQTLLWG